MSEVERFLAVHPPFDGLEESDLQRVANAIQVEFFPPGTVLLAQSGDPAEFLYMVRTGSVEFLENGQVVDGSEEGEVFGHPSLLSGAGPTATVRAAEDTLCYLVPRDVASTVLGTPSGLAFMALSLRRRLERATRRREAALADPRLAPVGSLVGGPPLETEPDVPIRSAAELMARERRSALLVRTDRGPGIVTDSDLRSRVVAQSLPYGRAVRDVMSFPVITVSTDQLVHEALLQMLEAGINHLVVVDEEGTPVGILSDRDVLGLERRRPFVLRGEIERARRVDEVSALGRELPAAMVTLARAGLGAVEVGHIVALCVDALTQRLLHLAAHDVGPSPDTWAWVALGSEARREQALGSDQDHALAYPDGADRHDSYFHKVAERVVEGLEASGLPRCRAGVLASEVPWRRSVSRWREAFDGWMRARDPEPVALTTIAFDYRSIAGPLDVEPSLDEVVRSADERPLFIRRLAKSALDFAPPVGLRGHQVEGRRQLIDLKHGGLVPVSDLARLFALQAGSAAKGTIERLRSARTAGTLDDEPGQVLEEAFRVVLDARLLHQVEQVEAGEKPDNLVDPSALGRLARTRLKEAFRAIAEVQKDVARGFRISRLA